MAVLRLDWTAVGDFVRDLCEWCLWATLTFPVPTSIGRAHERFRKTCRALARGSGEHVWVAWGWEPQRRGVLHFHALFGLPVGSQALLRAGDVRRHWGRGEKRVEEYEPERGAPYYLARHAEWDVNVACHRPPRCRRAHGCRVAPGPWSAQPS